jgi:hypothetical protein
MPIISWLRGRTIRPTPRRVACPRLVALEDRTTPATFTVLNTNDAGLGSLRQAILDANATPGYDTIAFAIPGGGLQTIQPLSPLPDITDPAGVLVDGYSQPGSSLNSLAVGDNAVLMVQLDGSKAGSGASGLTVTGGNTTIQGFVIGHFAADGILLVTGGSNTIRGNFLGTNAAGTAAAANGGDGLHVLAQLGPDAVDNPGKSNDNTIGGTSSGDRNLISGNAANGIEYGRGRTYNNIIHGNYIGTDSTGTAAIGNGTETGDIFNSGAGISTLDVNYQFTIGGTNPGAGNLISGNFGFGIHFNSANGGGGHIIQGNIIGANATASATLPNGGALYSYEAGGLTIGGTDPGAGNIFQGSIQLSGYDVVQGNYFGTNPSGSVVFPGTSIRLGTPNELFGGTAPGAGNVVAGVPNDGYALLVGGQNNVVQGNYFGTNSAGMNLGNAHGITVDNSGTNNLIGGTTPGAGNVFGFSADYAINIHGNDAPSGNFASGAVIQGNYIGTNADGANMGNNVGILIDGFGSSNNTIGGTSVGAGNTIAFNRGHGVLLWGNTGIGNAIRGNSVHDNGLLGIDLSYDSSDLTSAEVRLNDSVGHVGPNNFQNFPVLTSADPGGSTHFVGTLHSTPDATFSLDIFANRAPNDSLYGEGERYLGTVNVTTDNSGNASFDETVPGASSLGEFVTATATDSAGNTSEFSKAVPDGSSSPFVVTNTNDAGLGSLRYAILYADLTPGPNTITFNIPGGEPRRPRRQGSGRPTPRRPR